MWGFDLRGENLQSFSPLFVLVQIVDNIVVQLADCLKVNLPNVSQIADHLVVGRRNNFHRVQPDPPHYGIVSPKSSMIENRTF